MHPGLQVEVHSVQYTDQSEYSISHLQPIALCSYKHFHYAYTNNWQGNCHGAVPCTSDGK